MKIERLTGILNTPLFSVRELTSARTDWRKSISGAPLGDEAKSLIREVVKRTRLWSTERYDLAEELVSHFLDGSESGKSEEELIQKFGKPCKAAVMIRRAKKKNRPLLWHLGTGIRNGIVGLMAIYAVIVLAAMSKSPKPGIDYKALASGNLADIPVEETARNIYMDLFAKYDFHKFTYHTPESSSWPETVESFNTTYKDSLPGIRKAAAQSHSGILGKYEWEYTPDEYKTLINISEEDFLKSYPDGGGPGKKSDHTYLMTEILLPHLSLYKSISNVLITNILIQESELEWSEIPDDMEALFRISTHIMEQPFLINNLVGIAVMNRTYDSALRVVSDPDRLPDTTTIRRIAQIFDNYRHLNSIQFTPEKYFIKDLIQHCYSDDGNGNGVMTKKGMEILTMFTAIQPDQILPTRLLKWTGAGEELLAATMDSGLTYAFFPMIQAGTPRRQDISEYTEELWNFVDACSNRPLWDLNEKVSEWNNNETEFNAGGISGLPSRENMGLFYTLVEHISPRIALKPVMNRVHHDNTRLIIALHGYYQETGHWPEVLSDLVPGWLDEVPPDASTGKSLIYRIEDGKPLIYGRGYDGVDNGGQFDVPEKPGFHWGEKPRDTGDWLIWPHHIIKSEEE